MATSRGLLANWANGWPVATIMALAAFDAAWVAELLALDEGMIHITFPCQEAIAAGFPP